MRDDARRARFASQLRSALDEADVSVRSLAKRLNPESPETARSNLMRWLRGAHMPSRRSRRRVALELGLEANHFENNAPAAHLSGSTAGASTNGG